MGANIFYRAEAKAGASLALAVFGVFAWYLNSSQKPSGIAHVAYALVAALIARRFARGGSAASLVAAGAGRGKVVIVTGSNSGVGYYAALRLAQSGAKVIITCRSAELLQSTERRLQAEHDAEGRPNGIAKLDIVADLPPVTLDDFATVQRFAAAFKTRFTQLDVLLNNAGAMFMKQPIAFSTHHKKYELHTAVNFLGPVLLTELLLPVIRSTAGGRVVHVASEAHKMLPRAGIADAVDAILKVNSGEETVSGPLLGRGAKGAFARYGASKMLNMYYSYVLSERGVPSVSLHPGVVATNFFTAVVPQAVYSALYWATLLVCKTPNEGSQTSVHCALCPLADIIDSSKFYVDCSDATKHATRQARDIEAARKLVSWATDELKPFLA